MTGVLPADRAETRSVVAGNDDVKALCGSVDRDELINTAVANDFA